ncbi:hypothetical protein DWZ82_00050 [Butyricicoccus sp. AF35-5AC]|nr:hypothetical protein DWZ82_00050 [Butyricicoccus sp. AF35-5AC]
MGILICKAPALRGARTAQAVRPFWAAPFFLHQLTGAHEPRRRFALTGGAFFAEVQRGFAYAAGA